MTAGCVGSAFGLAFGIGALNRPLANGLLFYVLGFVVGAAVAVAARPLRSALRSAQRRVGTTPARRRVVAVGLAAATALLLLVAYSALVAPRQIDRVELSVPVPGLPAAWDGRQVAVLADRVVDRRGRAAGRLCDAPASARLLR